MYIGEIATCPIYLRGRIAIAVISNPDLNAYYEDDGLVLLLDPRTGEEIDVQGSGQWTASNLCTVTVGDATLLAGGCKDGAVELREPWSGDQVRVLRGHRGQVMKVCQVKDGGSLMLASASLDGTIRLWDPANGKHIRTFQADGHRPQELCTIGAGADSMLASACGRKILLWDPANDMHIRTLEGCSAGIGALCAVKIKDGGLLLLASGESKADQVEIDQGDVDEDATDCTVRLWNPVSGKQIRIFEGHSGPVKSICSFSIRNQYLLASASDDKTVRVWSPMSRTSILTIPIHYSARSIVWVNDSLVVGLDSGVIAIKLEPSQWSTLTAGAAGFDHDRSKQSGINVGTRLRIILGVTHDPPLA